MILENVDVERFLDSSTVLQESAQGRVNLDRGPHPKWGTDLQGGGRNGGAVGRVAQGGAGAQCLDNQGRTASEQIHRLAGKEVLLWVGGQRPQHQEGSAGQVGLQGHVLGMRLGRSITNVPTSLSPP